MYGGFSSAFWNWGMTPDLAHGQNRGALLPQRCRWLAGKIWAAGGRWWSGRGASPVNGEPDLG
jgi:hypothetical protein